MIIFYCIVPGLMLLSAHSRRRIIAISLIAGLAMLVNRTCTRGREVCVCCIIQAVLDPITR